MDLQPFKGLIKSRCGLSFDEARTPTLADAIQARMTESGFKSPRAYLALLERDDSEFSRLIDLITINETYFYREPAHLGLLAGRIVPELLASKKPGQKIRILSAGCSTGEEPYSVVMALEEAYGNNVKTLFTVIGADIDSGAIGKARIASYGRHSLRQIPGELKNKYFQTSGPSGFMLKDAVRDRVQFILLNLLSPVYPDSLKDMDVIFYRNVSIYFEPDTQRSIFSKLSDLLNEDGYLIVSATETLSYNIGMLSLVEIGDQFVYRKKVNVEIGDRRLERAPGPAADAGRTPSAGAGRRRDIPGRQTEGICAIRAVSAPAADRSPGERGPEMREPHALFDEALALARAKDFHAAIDRLDLLLAADPSFIKAYTLKASVLINLNDLEAADRMCLAAIGEQRWCLEAFLLLGLTAKVRGGEEAALKWFREALYVQSSCWLAHYYAADIYRLQGDRERARREYDIVVNLLGKGGIDGHGLAFFPLSFSIEQVVHLCNHNLQLLKSPDGEGPCRLT